MSLSLSEFDKLWDYDNPAETEQKLRDLLPAAEKSSDKAYLLELLTQIARTQGLQRKFADAHKTLDSVESALQSDMKRARVRYLLERGRVFNSSKQPDSARPFFLDAFALAQEAHEESLAVDAAHMMAIIEPPDKQIEWNLKAMNLAEESTDPRAQKWLGSLYNNLGWTFHDIGQYDEALELFQKGAQFREAHQQPKELRIAKWCVGRCLRSLGRVSEALETQKALLNEHKVAGSSDGYVQEELGECLLLLHREAESRPYFACAFDELSKDAWMVENEAYRLNRLKELAASV